MSAVARADAVAQSFRSHYPEYQHRSVEFVVEHLTDISRAFDGDLGQAVLLAIIGQARRAGLRGGRGGAAGEPGAAAALRWTNASRLAEVTGIPRETVRRKLLALEARGWIVQDAAGVWRLAVDPDGRDTPARRGLAALHERTLHRFARLVVDLGQLADRTPAEDAG